MLKSMYSGITGLKANQTKLDVIGNNIANVGTIGFKSQRINFKDALSQTLTTASAAGYNRGGTNASQVGLGVQIGSIVTNMTQGGLQTTGSNLDVSLDGSGFFMVAQGPLPASNEQGVRIDPNYHTIGGGSDLEVSYSRDGSFSLDSLGNLLTSDGYRILGYPVRERGGVNSSIDYANNGVCNFVDANAKNGVEASSDTLVPLKIPDTISVPATNYERLTNMTYTGKGNPTDQIQIRTNGVYKHDLNTNIKISFNPKFQEVDDTGANVGDPGPRFTISVNGKTPIPLEDWADAETGIEIPGKPNATLQDLGIELEVPPIYNDIGDGAGQMTVQEAKKHSYGTVVYAEGDVKVRSFAIEKDGLIKGVLDDGRVAVLGQLAIASFKNPAGLEKAGGNLYTVSSNSGEPAIKSAIGAPADIDNSKGYGTLLNGYLEMSNVDLSEQFTEMIVASRAFQANSKIITTGDEILQELANLKR